ncbi:HNH endonuclease signature motif containing protein [Nostocoides sp. HKS02]|uniref:HNH endonuclease signature motif containing protein n=1 Tax=Nostocoides sp. HKS02 TaxID=1813880 RepID=UPI0012B4634D|nr:HNH endonuclease signature motif containing protein [Tetrasphaera sp. HKS02]QGN57111.1 hypothetical protein GKE56_03530 [Tetrasphaera sp. HKS02]
MHAERLEDAALRAREEAEAEGHPQRRRVGERLPIDPQLASAASLAPLLHLSPRTMATRVFQARVVTRSLERTHAMAWDGELEPYRVEAIARAARDVRLDRLEEFEARLYDRDVAQLDRSSLAERARRAAARADAESLLAAAARGRTGRHVTVRAGDEPGMTTWTMSLPSAQSSRLWAAVETLAADYALANPHLPIGAARADALVDLALSEVQVTTTVTFVAPLPGEVEGEVEFRAIGERVCAGCADAGGLFAGPQPEEGECGCRPGLRAMVPVRGRLRDPVEDPRVGMILPTHLEQLVADPDLRVRLAARHPGTGTLRYQDPTTYRPGKALAAAVRLRDGHCRFPGCRTAAERCQLDHVVPAPLGPTEAANLQCLCTAHHGFKHHAGWTVTMDDQGFCTWTAPTGRRHHTGPRDFSSQAA